MKLFKYNKNRNFYLFLILLFLILFLVYIYIKYNYVNIENFNHLDAYNSLKVYKCPYLKKRVGNNNDGGYIITVIPNVSYDILLSGGIKDDSSFEDAFLDLFPNLECYAFDGTINNSPSKNSRFHFIKKNIGAKNTDNLTNLHTYLEKYRNAFIKMDIEGGEREWLDSLTDTHMNNISQLVIEIHYGDPPIGVPFDSSSIKRLEKINRTHVLVHFHGNNYCKTFLYDNITIPTVFEATYIHKKYFINSPELNTEPLPSSLDTPNNPDVEDISLNHSPFINNL